MYTFQSRITPSGKLDHPVTCNNAKNTVKHNFLISSALWHPHIVTISFLEKLVRNSVPSDIKNYNSGSPGGVFIISSHKNHVIYTRVIWNNNSSWCHWRKAAQVIYHQVAWVPSHIHVFGKNNFPTDVFNTENAYLVTFLN